MTDAEAKQELAEKLADIARQHGIEPKQDDQQHMFGSGGLWGAISAAIINSVSGMIQDAITRALRDRK